MFEVNEEAVFTSKGKAVPVKILNIQPQPMIPSIPEMGNTYTMELLEETPTLRGFPVAKGTTFRLWIADGEEAKSGLRKAE